MSGLRRRGLGGFAETFSEIGGAAWKWARGRASGSIVLALAARSRLDVNGLGGTNDATSRIGSFMGGAHLCADDCRYRDVRDRLLHGRGSPGVLQKMNEACDHRSGSPRFMLPMR